MAEISLGDIVARIRIDTSGLQQGLQQAMQGLQQFGQAKDRLITNLNSFQQALRQNEQALTVVGQRAQQANQSFQQFNQTNQQFNQTNQQFNQTTQRINQTFQQFNQTLTQTTTIINQGREAAQGFGSAFGNAWRNIAQIASGIGLATTLQGLVSGMKDFATSTIEAGSKLETLRAQFSAMQGTQAAQASLDSIFRTAQRLGVEFGTLATGFRQFDAATRGTALEGAKAERVFTQIVTGMRAMGATSDQVGRALLALQQMVSKGTVSQEELRQQLGEALPGAMNIAARALGTTTAELNKMIEKGMDATTFVQAFANQVQQEFGGKAATATNTLATAWTRLTNEFQQFQGALAASGLADSLRDIANWMAKVLETWRQARREREREVGGRAPEVPPELQGLSPVITARQKEIERLRAETEDRRDFGSMLGGVPVPGLSPEERSADRTARIRQLQEEQRQDIARLQRQLLAEGAAPGATGPGPADAALEAITKALEEGKARLRQLDVGEELLPSLDAAKEKTQEWRKVLDAVFEQIKRIPDPLLRSIMPAVQRLINPANQLMEALTADEKLAADAARTVRDLEQFVREQEREAAQDLAQDRRRRQAERGELDIFGLLLSPEQEAELKEQARTQRQRIQEFARSADLLGLDISPELEQRRRATTAFAQRVQAQIDQQLATREQRPEVRLRAEGERQGAEITPEIDAQLKRLTELREEQERLNHIISIWGDLSQGIGSAWTNALMSIAGGTRTVAEAFREMARSIMQSMTQIASQEAFKAIFKIGATFLTAWLGSSTAIGGDTSLATTGGSSGFLSGLGASSGGQGGFISGLTARGYQHGGVINRPTLALMGENPATSPEYVLNRQQMQSMMQTRSGQNGGISIINVSSKDEAERQAAQERAMGRQVIINEVLSDLRQGSGSQIGRLMRVSQQ